MPPEDAIVVPSALRHLRRFPMDGALLLFDRRSGLTALCDGPETAHLQMRAPRVIQFSLTNACNLSCGFCSRDISEKSSFTKESAFELLWEMDQKGSLEVAFGGGEPLVFKGFVDLLSRLRNETQLAVHFTTNGTLLTHEMAKTIAPYIGEVRVSVYDNVELRPIVAALRNHHIGFGFNWLVVPKRLPHLGTFLLDAHAMGCNDVLLLAYKGDDVSLHLSPLETAELASQVKVLSKVFAGRLSIKLDVCWGNRMQAVPRLFDGGACPAGRDFVVITSDRKVAPCSFHQTAIPFENADDLLKIWSSQRGALAMAATRPGCARTDDYGLSFASNGNPAATLGDGPVRHLPIAGASL